MDPYFEAKANELYRDINTALHKFLDATGFEVADLSWDCDHLFNCEGEPIHTEYTNFLGKFVEVFDE
jgi:hypothetical protein